MKELDFKLNASKHDVVSIRKYLAGYDSELAIYHGDYTADWLLSDVQSSKWIVKTSKTIQTKEGDYKYVKTFNWSRQMPDGSYLDYPEHQKLLSFLQRAMFIAIESSSVFKTMGVGSLPELFKGILHFTQWAFKEGLGLNPSDKCFSLLTQSRVEMYFKEISTGGFFLASGFVELFVKRFKGVTGHLITSSNPFYFNEDDRNKVESFFKETKCYVRNSFGANYLDRNRLRKVFEFDKSVVYLDRFTAFLRQFEPDLMSANKQVLLTLKPENEYPGHTTPLVADVINAPESHSHVLKQMSFIKELLKLKPLFAEALPSPEEFKFDEISNYVRRTCKISKLTPWIPLPIFLQALNSAIGFMLSKGELIVECIEEVYSSLVPKGLMSKSKLTECEYARRDLEVARILRKYDKLNLQTLHVSCASLDRIREKPTLVDSIGLLQAACYIIIASLKPIRISELSSLKYDCLYYKDGDGYWLMQEISKSGIDNILPEDAKPIPQIAAKAITFLQRLNRQAGKYCPSAKESKYLLYSLNYGYGYLEGSIGSSEHIRGRVSRFCDYIETPLDEYGRRWYVNIHELRKSFLLTYFWTYKFSSLESARWMAGHKDIEHIYSYIQSNVPGEEMVEIESEYAYQQLRLFKEGHTMTDIENITELNHDVCHHFQVKSISELKEKELKEWITFAIESGKYELHAYNINSSLIDNEVTVAIKIL